MHAAPAEKCIQIKIAQLSDCAEGSYEVVHEEVIDIQMVHVHASIQKRWLLNPAHALVQILRPVGMTHHLNLQTLKQCSACFLNLLEAVYKVSCMNSNQYRRE